MKYGYNSIANFTIRTIIRESSRILKSFIYLTADTTLPFVGLSGPRVNFNMFNTTAYKGLCTPFSADTSGFPTGLSAGLINVDHSGFR